MTAFVYLGYHEENPGEADAFGLEHPVNLDDFYDLALLEVFDAAPEYVTAGEISNAVSICTDAAMTRMHESEAGKYHWFKWEKEPAKGSTTLADNLALGALANIHRVLGGKPRDSDALDEIAIIMRENGFRIEDINPQAEAVDDDGDPPLGACSDCGGALTLDNSGYIECEQCRQRWGK